MPLPAIGLALGGLLSGGVGALSAGAARGQAQQLIQQSVEDLKAIGIPPEEAMRISLEKYKSEGILTPEMEANILQGRTEMEGIETDPRLQDAEMSALNELRNVGQSGGMRLTDRANLNNVLGELDSVERGKRDAILLDAAQRGGATGGATLASQMLNQQSSAQRANQAGLQTAGQAQDAALQAILQSGQLAGQMQGRSFDQQAKIKQAQDYINQMNTAAQQGVQQRNVDSRNAAQQYNLGQAQALSNANVDLGNQQEMYNKGLAKDRFGMEMQKGQALANARNQQASNVQAGGQADQQMWGKIGGGVAQIGQSVWDADEREKDRKAGIVRPYY